MSLDTQKVVVQTTEKQGTMQNGTKTSYKQAERRFFFKRKGDGPSASRNSRSTSSTATVRLISRKSGDRRFRTFFGHSGVGTILILGVATNELTSSNL
jgi:hypothetical protein